MKFRPIFYLIIPPLLLVLLIWLADDGYRHSNYYGEGTLSFTIVDKGECRLKINGDINKSLEQNFKEIFDQSAKSDCKSYQLILNSNGGNIGVALTLGDLIREKKMTTIVQQRCKSACLYLFISGETRIVSKYAVLGMHQAIDIQTKECINPKLNTKDNRDFHKGLLQYSQEKLGSKAGKFFNSKENIADCREMLEINNKEFLEVGIITNLTED
jgi:hypothetical protein